MLSIRQRRRVSQRFDFKGSQATVELQDKDLMLSAEDETKLRNMNDILQSKLVKRGISLKALDYQKIEPAAGGTVRQTVKIQQGIPIEKAKEVVKFIKDSKLKVQASIQGETVRISGKDRDTLQDVIAKLKAKDFGIDMKFDNYRTTDSMQTFAPMQRTARSASSRLKRIFNLIKPEMCFGRGRSSSGRRARIFRSSIISANIFAHQAVSACGRLC